MAGIYLHIPFCKQACYYCNFHFSTLLTHKEKVVKAIAKELFLRKDELAGQTIETIYFGGGTPSLLSFSELDQLFDAIAINYDISGVKEITMEANPDDLNADYLRYLASSRVNRLSIGIQTFDDQQLKLMHRAHTSKEAIASVRLAQECGLNQISIDLIYGIPGMDQKNWEENLNQALNLEVDHISSYCLTIEEKTVFGKYQKQNKIIVPEDEVTAKQFETLIRKLSANGFEHYEISNFARNKHYSKHNTSYWQGIPYIGIGPGAHSFYPGKRMWNINNNHQYVSSIEKGVLPLEIEILTLNNQFNEFVMTGLRTQWGVNLIRLQELFGSNYLSQLKMALKRYIENGQVIEKSQHYMLSSDAKFLADGIASEAFILD